MSGLRSLLYCVNARIVKMLIENQTNSTWGRKKWSKKIIGRQKIDRKFDLRRFFDALLEQLDLVIKGLIFYFLQFVVETASLQSNIRKVALINSKPIILCFGNREPLHLLDTTADTIALSAISPAPKCYVLLITSGLMMNSHS